MKPPLVTPGKTSMPLAPCARDAAAGTSAVSLDKAARASALRPVSGGLRPGDALPIPVLAQPAKNVAAAAAIPIIKLFFDFVFILSFGPRVAYVRGPAHSSIQRPACAKLNCQK